VAFGRVRGLDDVKRAVVSGTQPSNIEWLGRDGCLTPLPVGFWTDWLDAGLRKAEASTMAA